MNTSIKILLVFVILFGNCQERKTITESKYFSKNLPKNDPLPLLPELTPKNKIIHKGLFSPNGNEYYFVISNENFTDFDIKIATMQNNQISKVKDSPFNSEHDDHGLSFSPDGLTAYFSSTRPVNQDSIPNTWHIWYSKKNEDLWENPKYLEIPSLENKLISHPTVTDSGKLYFHASNLDYSEMDLYSAEKSGNSYRIVQKIEIPSMEGIGKCTPYISPDESYLIFAKIGDQLDLYISYKAKNGNWKEPIKFPRKINTNGQGNPMLTPDSRYLLFTSINSSKEWVVNWVSTQNILKEE